MTIAIFGSVNLDVSAYVARLPGPGETVQATSSATALGGKGANQAVAVARLSSGAASFVAAIGTDAAAGQITDELSAFGVDTGALTAFEGPSGLALIQIDEAGQNTITVIGGANMAWPDIGPTPGFLEGVDILVVQLEVPLAAVRSAMEAARASGTTVILDPAPVGDAAAVRDLLSLADVVTPNESECESLIGWRPSTLEEAERAAAELVSLGAGTAVVKLGGRGLSYATGSGAGHVPPFEVTAVDTVAAGDAFCGALAVGLDEGLSLEEALRFASATGALSATVQGAAGSIPTRDAVTALVERGAANG